MIQSSPAVILLQPQMGENIGMCARAMLNCGLTDLRLVSPRDGWPNSAAMATASGATSVIEQARVYDTLADAIGDCTFVVGTGSFDRDMVKDVLTPEMAVQAVVAADRAAGHPVSALVFGPERSGMTNDDVTLCDAYVTIPLNPDYPSLNLAQAVLLVSYAWFRMISDDTGINVAGGARFMHVLGVDDPDRATHAQLHGLFDHLLAALDGAGFFTNDAQRPVMVRNLRNTLHRLRLRTQEVNTLRGMLKALMQWGK